MQISYRLTKGSQPTKPSAVDMTSSPTVVYLRRNIERITEVDEEGNETYLWRYEEAKLTPKEYEDYLEEASSLTMQTLMQQTNELQASQELSDITAEMNHEEQMQLLNDIQADIILG